MARRKETDISADDVLRAWLRARGEDPDVFIAEALSELGPPIHSPGGPRPMYPDEEDALRVLRRPPEPKE